MGRLLESEKPTRRCVDLDIEIIADQDPRVALPRENQGPPPEIFGHDVIAVHEQEEVNVELVESF